jgi:hypothetical protein
MDSLPPSWNSEIFNSSAFIGKIYLTKQEADDLYLPILAGKNLYLIDGITPGSISAGQAVIVDALKNISGFNDITMTGELFMTGNAKDIHIDGIGSKVNFSGLGSGIIMSSLTSSIVMSSTLSNSISTAGGISVGSVLFGATQASYLTSITPGTGQASKALILNSSSNIGSINSLAADTISASTSIAITRAAGGDMISLTSSSTSARNTIKFITDLQSYEIGTRGSTAANPNNFYIYNGAYKLLMNPTGDTSILSSTDSSSASTGCLKLSGGLGVVKNIYCTGTLTLDRNGSNLAFQNGIGSGLIELAASPSILRIVKGYAINVGSNGITIASGSSADPRYSIDFQTGAADVQINFFQSSGGGSLYGIGANNSSVEMHTGGSFTWYNGTTANGSLGTNLMTLTSAGTLTTTQNLIATAGVHASTFSTAGLAALGNSAHMHYAASVGSFFTYNYNSGTYGNTMIGNNSIASCSNGYVNINTSSFAQNAPLAVFGSAPFTRITGFGYLASSGSGTAVGFTNRPFSIYSEWGILVQSGEIDVFSDLRMKKDVLALDDEICYRFIKNIKPIQFKYRHDEDRNHYGYSAQELMSYGFNTLVGLTHADEPLPPEKIPTYIPNMDGEMVLSGESIDLPGDVRCVVSMIDMIPMLHKCIQKQMKRLNEQQVEIEKLKKHLNITLR